MGAPVTLVVIKDLINLSILMNKSPESAAVVIVASEASDLIFKIVIFHDVPHRSSS